MLKSLLYFLCFSFGIIAFAQENNAVPEYYDSKQVEKQNISEKDLQEFYEDEDFDYSENLDDGENLWTKFMDWLGNIIVKFWEAIFGAGSAEGIVLSFLRVLPYVLLGLMLFLLIKFFLRVSSRNVIFNSGIKGDIAISEEEQIIKNENISDLITNAVKQNNFRLAIRYYYLLCLQKLTENDTIDWQPDKTNTDYLNEISTSEIKSNFKHITRIYDYVWYGEFNVDALKFESLKLPFINLQNAIGE